MTENQQTNTLDPKYLESRKVHLLGYTANFLAQITAASGQTVFLFLNEKPAPFAHIVGVWHRKPGQPLPSPSN